MGPLHEISRRLAPRHLSLPSRLVLLVLFAGGFHVAALTNGVDRATRSVRQCVSRCSSGSCQRLTRGSGTSASSRLPAIEPDTARQLSASGRNGNDGASPVAILGPNHAAFAIPDDAALAPRTSLSQLLSRLPASASGRAPPTA